jgi:hypothetical protein
MLAVSPRSKRRLKRVLLRGLRLGRRQYLSLISAAVLLVALVLALTNSSLEVDGRTATRPPAAAASAAPADAVAAVTAPTPLPTGPESHEVFYYMFSSEWERNDFELAIQADMRDLHRRGMPVPSQASRQLLVVTTKEEEAAAFQYLNDLFLLSQSEGFGFYFFDLR